MPDESLSEFHASPIPPVEITRQENIWFLHPGYPAPCNILLSLPRVDQTAHHTFGIHHKTALTACQIIGNNAFETGRFCHDKDGQQPVTVPLDEALTDSTYYFLVDNGASKYPIVPSFQDWEFPHGRIPDTWRLPSLFSDASTSRCGITNFSICTEEAHIVPKEEVHWYLRNGMSQYGRDLGDIDDSANLLSLRSDIHKCFDNRWLVIVPKVAGGGGTFDTDTSSRSARYVSHILSRRAAEYWPTYHNTVVQYIENESGPYLFARFAWAVLLLVKAFVTSGYPRHVIRVQELTDVEDIETAWKEELLSGAQLRASYSGGGSKSATKKRKSELLEEEDDLAESSEDSNIGMGSDIWDNVMDEWEARGQRRKQISSETAPEIIAEDGTAQEKVAHLKSGSLEM
ncbi:hypothetical protein GX50_07729 [[Emmonsia] crescens]|uniref:HNH nuclease domain-containing protein n=1 Tax=[Emmonsia] crescens TaxID=73230 RepID=A0A2B7Z7X1_9EURO|nr:hypothetical protein GX50_07729 [Emmonsia crescens]